MQCGQGWKELGWPNFKRFVIAFSSWEGAMRGHGCSLYLLFSAGVIGHRYITCPGLFPRSIKIAFNIPKTLSQIMSFTESCLLLRSWMSASFSSDCLSTLWTWQTSLPRRAWGLLQKTESLYKIAGFLNLVLFLRSGRSEIPPLCVLQISSYLVFMHLRVHFKTAVVRWGGYSWFLPCMMKVGDSRLLFYFILSCFTLSKADWYKIYQITSDLFCGICLCNSHRSLFLNMSLWRNNVTNQLSGFISSHVGYDDVSC